jgi:hypothetical protein
VKKGGVEPSQGIVLYLAQISVSGDEEDEVMSSSRSKVWEENRWPGPWVKAQIIQGCSSCIALYEKVPKSQQPHANPQATAKPLQSLCNPICQPLGTDLNGAYTLFSETISFTSHRIVPLHVHSMPCIICLGYIL